MLHGETILGASFGYLRRRKLGYLDRMRASRHEAVNAARLALSRCDVFERPPELVREQSVYLAAIVSAQQP